MARAPKPTLSDRFLLWISRKKEVEGLLIATVESDVALLEKIARSLALIKVHDRPRHIRLSRAVDRIWVRLLPGDIARFNASIGACELDTRFVRESATEFIASAIVHEATHARIWRAGVEYDLEVRERVEMLCIGQELKFAATLPDGRDLQTWIESRLQYPPDFGDSAFTEREYAGLIDALRHRGVPDWLIRSVVALGRMRRALSRLVRR